MLELNNLTKSFDGTLAVKHFNLTVEQGKTTVLIGPSGCGKSTVLRMIMGLLPIDSGFIKFESDTIRPEIILHLRRKMGYVIQDGGLFPHLTAYKNITLMASHVNWSREKIDERVNLLIELTRFPRDGLMRFPAQLSGGQRQRVSLMRALMLDPELLLMDEPLGALDPLIRMDLQTELKSIFQKLDKTVLIVTHDLPEAGYLGDKIVLMRDGELVQQGTLDELLIRPENSFVTRFVNAQRGHFEEIESKSR